MNTKKKIVTFAASALAVVMASTVALSAPVQNSSLGLAVKDEAVQFEKKNAVDEVVPNKDTNAIYDLVKSGAEKADKKASSLEKELSAPVKEAAPEKIETKKVDVAKDAVMDGGFNGSTKVTSVQEITLPESKIQETLGSGESIAVQTADGVVMTDKGTKTGFGTIKRDDGKIELVYYYTVGGKQHIASTDMLYDPAANQLIGDGQRGLLSLGFDLDMNQMVFYSAINPWQRQFGFCELYDITAPLIGCHYNTERFKFEYNGMEWMIQPWKGQYGITTGAEIGVYHKPLDRATDFYDCVSDEEMLKMGFRLDKNYNTGKWETLFYRPVEYNWWVTGFKVGEVTSWRNLRLIGTIILKDEEMCKAFIGALEEKGFEKDKDYLVKADPETNKMTKVILQWI